jgi:hypothetical protein
MLKSKTPYQIQDPVRQGREVILNLGLMKIRFVSKSLWNFDIHLKFDI